MRNRLIHCDCMKLMPSMPDASVDFILTDIPYGNVSRLDGHIRNLDKGKADIVTFTLEDFLPHIYRLVRNSLVVFCGMEFFSDAFKFFRTKDGSCRALIYAKTNPMPSNPREGYLSSVEVGIWFKKRGGVFNGFCKPNVLRHPCGRSKIHPTEKNHALLKDLILDNTNEGDLVFDPCAGSGSTLLVAKQLGRRYFGCELDAAFHETASKRLRDA